MVRHGTIRPPVRMPPQELNRLERVLGSIGLYGRSLTHFQKRMAFEETRAYMEAAKNDRTKNTWNRLSVDPKALTQTSRASSSQRADWLFLNDPIGRHVIDVLTDNTVGTGIKTQSKIQYSKRDATTNEKTNQRVEDLKSRWQEEADARGQMHWFEMQALWLQRVATVGDVLLHKVFLDDPKRVLPLAYEMIESARLTDYAAKPAGKNTVEQGVELDADGNIVAYHVDSGDMKLKVERFPVEDCRLGYRMDRPGMIRGLTWMGPVVSHIFTLRDLVDYTMIARKVQAAVAVIVADGPNGKSAGIPGLPRTPGDTSTTDPSGSPKRPIAPGMIHNVGAGTVTALQPSQNHDFEALTKILLRGIGVGFGFSYEWASGDYEQTSYAGGRLSNQEARRRIRPVHGFTTFHLERPVHREFIDVALAFQKMPRPPIAQNEYAVRFSQPHWEWGVNPAQEVKAAADAVKAGLSTHRDEIEARGGDWQEVFRQMQTEFDFAETLGLNLYQELRDDGSGSEDPESQEKEQGAAT